MKVIHLLLFMLMLGSSSCMWGVPDKQKADITKDTLTYAYHTINQRAADCNNKPDSACSAITLKYPVFNGQQVLNDTVQHKLLKMVALNGERDTSLRQLISTFFKSVKTYKVAAYTNILRQDSSLATFSLETYTAKSGTRPDHKTVFINWNTKAKRSIYLDDIFTNGYRDKLTKIADTIFRKQEKLSAAASLKNDYFFKDGQFALNNNYCITPLGIRFFYNIYEIKPYAAGTTDLFIPYAKIKSLLRPNTVIIQYIK